MHAFFSNKKSNSYHFAKQYAHTHVYTNVHKWNDDLTYIFS